MKKKQNIQSERSVRTFKTRIYLDDFSKQYCERAFGVRRWVWNWGLSYMLSEKAKTKKLPNNYSIDPIYRKAVKAKQDAGFEWIANQLVSGKVMCECLKDLAASFEVCKAYQSDVDWHHICREHKEKDYRGNRKWHKVQPKFKKRKECTKQSFRYAAGDGKNVRIEGDHLLTFCTCVKGQRAHGRTRESLAFLRHPSVKLCTMTILNEAGRYWVVITYEKPNHIVKHPQAGTKVGIDLGVKISACCYDGTNFFNGVFNTENSLRVEQLAKNVNDKLKKKTHGSSRYLKQLRLQQERYARAARMRNVEVEKFTTYLCENYETIILDDFSFDGAKNVCDNAELYRCMVCVLKQRLYEKAPLYGCKVYVVNHVKGEKTTKRCSLCGSTNVHVFRDRTMCCDDCNQLSHMDRDKNAAINTYYATNYSELDMRSDEQKKKDAKKAKKLQETI